MRFAKQEILEHFHRQDIAYRVSLLASHWISGGNQYAPSAANEARGTSIIFDGRLVSCEDIADMLEDQQQVYRVASEFALNQLHALIRTPFEILCDYCEDYDRQGGVKLYPILREAPWFYFARHVRNAISHNFRYEFKADEIKRLPVTWNGLTISADMQGKDMTATVWHKPGYLLFLAMRDFAQLLPTLKAQ